MYGYSSALVTKEKEKSFGKEKQFFFEWKFFLVNLGFSITTTGSSCSNGLIFSFGCLYYGDYGDYSD